MDKIKAYSYIRFSTSQQLKGDSERRQWEIARDYAKDNNLSLDESLTYNDYGLSAYKGENKRPDSALRMFLDATKDGTIPEGSILIVESLDRISREQFTDAYALFSEIINSVKIVTLDDRQEYTKESINNNDSQIYTLIGGLKRAHNESKLKSFRVRQAWEKKRNNLSTKKLTSIGPNWLRFDGSDFQKVEERCQIVEGIFKDSLAGMGMEMIAKKLNKNRTPCWGRSEVWRKSYISKILKNRQVLGEFQPHKIRDGKSTPAGSPIDNYYPRIISDELFYQVQNRFASMPRYGGRNGKLTNLFGGLAKCGYCGSSMRFENKGYSSKGGQYLVCDKAVLGSDCEQIRFKYHEFEKVFLDFCNTLKIKEVLRDDDKSKEEVTKLRGQLVSIRGQIKDIAKKIENITKAIRGEERPKIHAHLKDDLDQLFHKQEELETKKVEIERDYKKVTVAKGKVQKDIKGLQALRKKILESAEIGSIDLKLRLRNQIRTLVKRVEIFPAGRILTKERIEKYFTDHQTEDELDFLLSKKRDTSEMFFRVHYINGNLTVVTPATDNPLGYEKSYEREEDWITVANMGKTHFKINTTEIDDDSKSVAYFKALYGEEHIDESKPYPFDNNDCGS